MTRFNLVLVFTAHAAVTPDYSIERSESRRVMLRIAPFVGASVYLVIVLGCGKTRCVLIIAGSELAEVLFRLAPF